VFENRVLRRRFGPKRQELTGGWRKFHEKLHNFYSLQTIVKDHVKQDEVCWECNMHAGTVEFELVNLKARGLLGELSMSWSTVLQ
jgi:hypothetical protein